MNAKRKGARNEHRTMRVLEGLGYACTRAAASLGVFDVVAVGPTGVKLIQVKSNRWPGSLEMETIQMFPIPTIGVTREVWRWDDNSRYPLVRTV